MLDDVASLHVFFHKIFNICLTFRIIIIPSSGNICKTDKYYPLLKNPLLIVTEGGSYVCDFTER